MVHKTQIKLVSMAASSALSTPMILNSHGHNNACDQPQHFIAIKPPLACSIYHTFCTFTLFTQRPSCGISVSLWRGPLTPSLMHLHSSHAQPEGRGARHTNVDNLVCGWHPVLWINDLNACQRLFCHYRPSAMTQVGGGGGATCSLWPCDSQLGWIWGNEADIQ